MTCVLLQAIQPLDGAFAVSFALNKGPRVLRVPEHARDFLEYVRGVADDGRRGEIGGGFVFILIAVVAGLTLRHHFGVDALGQACQPNRLGFRTGSSQDYVIFRHDQGETKNFATLDFWKDRIGH